MIRGERLDIEELPELAILKKMRRFSHELGLVHPRYSFTKDVPAIEYTGFTTGLRGPYPTPPILLSFSAPMNRLCHSLTMLLYSSQAHK